MFARLKLLMCRAATGILWGIFLVVAYQGAAYAAPWDVDMYTQPSYKSNEIARAPVEGTVPVGRMPFTLSTEEAGAKLRNPIPISTESIWRGRRLWSVQCGICHGVKGDGMGPVGPSMAVPNLLTDFYGGRPDGRIYGVIHNGQGNMPRYGYKLSADEHWDLVNYIRFLQGKNVKGISRPE